MKDEKDEKAENLITTDTESHTTVDMHSVSSNIININKDNRIFNILPDELTEIVNKYKERDENFQDIKYFKDKGGINSLLTSLNTDKNNGISSIAGREEFFGSNKIFRKPPPSFWDFVKEAICDKMIIILICCSIFEIGVSM